MLRAILVDNEKPALTLLEKLLGASGSFEICGMYTKPSQALEMLKETEVDVVFLDIEMPGINGIEAAERILEIDAGIDIVFTTAYSHYATEAFELSAIDYVLKPVIAGRLNKTIERILSRRNRPFPEVRKVPEEAGDSAADRRIVFHSFQRFEWIGGASEAVKWRTAKEREMMAYLVHYRNRFVQKDKILEDLMPGTEHERARAYLHTCVYNIRKKLAGLGRSAVLEYRNNAYRLELRDILLDADEFVRVAGGSGDIHAGNIGDYIRAAELYRGDYMEEDGFIWSLEEQVRLKDMCISMLKRMAEYYRLAKEYRQAASCLRRILHKNPFLDDVNESMLRLYSQMGDRLSMVQHYRSFEKLLKEELGIEPVESTRNLYRELCSGSAGETA